jgi:zinc protease
MKRLYREVVLDNGLKVLLKEIHTAPLVSAWIWYRVGSRDETTGRTGVSHWVEHMQFKGTTEFPASVLDRAISRDGGIWNAFTYLDWTAYFETMPAEKIELGLRLEADRMVNSLYDPAEVDSERTVILSEREGSENDPQFRLQEAVQQAAFRVHPYHHEVIGETADLRSMTRNDLYEHYRLHYQPGNAVLSLAGAFSSDEMLMRIRDLFGPIPPGPTPLPRLARPEPPAAGEHRLTVEGPGETTFVQIAYHAPAAPDAAFLPMTVLDSLLAGPSSLSVFGGGGVSNKTSRLYRALVEKELAVGVSSGLSVTVDPFLYTINLTIHPKRGPEEALAALDEEMERIREQPVSAAEIGRAIKQARALFAYNSETVTSHAAWLGLAEMFADYEWFLTYLDRLAQVTPAEMQKAAQEYLRPQNRVVGTYKPTGTEIQP